MNKTILILLIFSILSCQKQNQDSNLLTEKLKSKNTLLEQTNDSLNAELKKAKLKKNYWFDVDSEGIDFVKKGIEEYKKGKLCVFLLPVSTSTILFHDFILPEKPEIRFIRGRLSFQGYNTKGEWVTNKKGMHDSMLVIMDGKNGL